MDFFDAIAKSSHGGELSCQHEYKMDEEVGIICSLCHSVITEMRYVLPRFVSEFIILRKKLITNLMVQLDERQIEISIKYSGRIEVSAALCFGWLGNGNSGWDAFFLPKYSTQNQYQILAITKNIGLVIKAETLPTIFLGFTFCVTQTHSTTANHPF